ncbi:MAG: acyltransferase [Fibrobacteria bacterium]
MRFPFIAASVSVPGRIKQLDVLRGIAVLLVLGHHKYIAPCLVQMGWIGVDLFFTLSGFLVSGLLFEEYRKTGKLDLARFLIRRGFKIYPSFWAFLAGGLLLMAIYPGPIPAWRNVIAEIFFLQNYFQPVFPHTWSLAVEEHFYLLLPMALAIFAWRSRGPGGSDPFRAMPVFFLVAASAILGLRIWNYLSHPYTYMTHHYASHLRMDGLLFGVLLSYWHHFHHDSAKARVNRFAPLLIVFSVAALFPPFLMPQENFFMNTVGLSLEYLAFGAILMLSMHWENRSVARIAGGLDWVLRPIAVVGFYSYTVYLWHYPAIDYSRLILRHLLGMEYPYILEIIVYVGGAIAAGILASRLVETPCLKLRNRLFPRNAAPRP